MSAAVKESMIAGAVAGGTTRLITAPFGKYFEGAGIEFLMIKFFVDLLKIR